MEKTYFICDASNALAVRAIKSALSKLSIGEFYFTPVVCDETGKLNEIVINGGLDQIGENAEQLLKSFKEDRPDCAVYVIDIKETVIFERSRAHPELVCIAAVMNKDMTKAGWAYYNPIQLPAELQEHLVARKDIYEAINLSFEEKVTKETDLCYYFSKKEKLLWYEEAATKLLMF